MARYFRMKRLRDKSLIAARYKSLCSGRYDGDLMLVLIIIHQWLHQSSRRFIQAFKFRGGDGNCAGIILVGQEAGIHPNILKVGRSMRNNNFQV